MCHEKVTSFLCKHKIIQRRECSPTERNSTEHTLSIEQLTSPEICPDCRHSHSHGMHRGYHSMTNIVRPKLIRASKSLSRKVNLALDVVASWDTLNSPLATKLKEPFTKTEYLPPLKLDSKTIEKAHSVTSEDLSSMASNPDVLRMIKKETAKKRPYVASLTSSQSASSSASNQSSTSPGTDSTPPTPTVKDTARISGYFGHGPNQSSLEERNTIPSQEPVDGKSTAVAPDILKIGTAVASSTEDGPKKSARRGSRSEEQAQELYFPYGNEYVELPGSEVPQIPSQRSIRYEKKSARRGPRVEEQAPKLYFPYRKPSSVSPSAYVELPGSEVPQLPSQRSTRYERPRPAELAASPPPPGSRISSPIAKVSQRSFSTPDRFQQEFLDLDRVPVITITPPTPPETPHDPESAKTTAVSGPLTSGKFLSPDSARKRGKDYKTSNSRRSKNEVVRNHDGQLVPQFASQSLPIVPVVVSQSVARNSPVLAADLQDTKTSFGLDDKSSARVKPYDLESAKPTVVSGPLNSGTTSSPILAGKRGKDYKILNSRRSKNEIVRNHDGQLVPRFASQSLPIVPAVVSQSVARNSPVLAADLQDTKTLVRLDDKSSASIGQVSEPHHHVPLNDTNDAEIVDHEPLLQKE